jgi:hypothetical protein
MMTEKLWFKQWASSYLTDPRIDRLTDAAAVLLQRMRCVCCLEGSCPVETSEIARKTMRSESQVIVSLPSVLQFFVQREDRLFDVGQERDNAVTERGRKGAQAANAKRRASGTSDAAGDAQGDGASDAHAHVDSWLTGLEKFRSSDAASDGAGDATSDAQKLEVRSKEVKNSEDPRFRSAGLSQIFRSEEVKNLEGQTASAMAMVGSISLQTVLKPVQNVGNVPHGTLENRPPKPSLEVESSQWGDRLVIPDGHGRYKPRSTTTTNTGSERREAV